MNREVGFARFRNPGKPGVKTVGPFLIAFSCGPILIEYLKVIYLAGLILSIIRTTWGSKFDIPVPGMESGFAFAFTTITL